MKHLPRLVSMLNGTPERKAMVKAAFTSIVIVPPQTFINSNQPRVRQSELLTPAELMMFLHDVEKDVGLKQAIEGTILIWDDVQRFIIIPPTAIGICFSMTDVYRSEVLAVVMQQIVDESVLPVLFLRTVSTHSPLFGRYLMRILQVMQAVATYKSLIPFVCSTLLSRLITKKVWTNAQLWEGFIRCAKQTEPSSFDALLQLPKEQLRDLVEKQPVMKGKLREYVLKKAGNKGNKTRLAGFLEVLGEVPPEGQTAADGTIQS
jgi:symplekin